jgi:hypothetical protein
MAFNISFSETPNSGTCAVSGSPVQCNDIFVLTGGLLNDDFDYNGDTYYVNIFPLDGVALSQLEDDACEAANVPDGCIGFSTVEGQSNSIRFGFTISTEPQQVEVPEPGMLALLGASLFGLGALRRRRLS